MATQKELLDAMKVIKNHCEDQQAIVGLGKFNEACSKCLLRNSYGDCGLMGESESNMFTAPSEWLFVEPENPKLMAY